MLKELAQDFAQSGEVYLKANREAPITVGLRFKTQTEPDAETQRVLNWKRKKDEAWLVGTGALVFLRHVKEYVGEVDPAMSAYVELSLKIATLPQGRERRRLLAVQQNRTRNLPKKRKGSGVNWRKAITESKVARRMVLKMLYKEALGKGKASKEVFGDGKGESAGSAFGEEAEG